VSVERGAAREWYKRLEKLGIAKLQVLDHNKDPVWVLDEEVVHHGDFGLKQLRDVPSISAWLDYGDVVVVPSYKYVGPNAVAGFPDCWVGPIRADETRVPSSIHPRDNRLLTHTHEGHFVFALKNRIFFSQSLTEGANMGQDAVVHLVWRNPILKLAEWWRRSVPACFYDQKNATYRRSWNGCIVSWKFSRPQHWIYLWKCDSEFFPKNVISWNHPMDMIQVHFA